MEFNEFPQNFADEKEEEIDAALEKANQSLAEIHADAEEAAEEDAKEKTEGSFVAECPRTFKGYIRAIGFYKLKRSVLWMIPIGIILGIVFSLSGIVEDGPGALGVLISAIEGGIGMPIALLILRPVVAYTYAIIFCPIGYPLYLLIHKLLEKRLDKRLCGVIQNHEEKYEELRSAVEAAYRQREGEIREEVKAYEDAFYARMEERRALFAKSAHTDKIAEWLLTCFKERYESANRSADVENISVSFRFITAFSMVSIPQQDEAGGASLFIFSENRFPEMEDCCEIMALADVLAERLEEAIKNGFAIDEKASVAVERVVDEGKFPLGQAIVRMELSTPNPAYAPLQSW